MEVKILGKKMVKSVGNKFIPCLHFHFDLAIRLPEILKTKNVQLRYKLICSTREQIIVA